MAQVAEHILGKDEVTSSNLVISSINPRKLRVCGDFCCSDFEENGEKWAKMRCVMHRLCTNGKQGQDVLNCKTLSVVHLASLQINHSFYLTDLNKRHKADPFIPSPPPLHPSQSTPPWAPREPSRDSDNTRTRQPSAARSP